MGDTAPWSRCKSELYSFFGRNPRSNRAVVTFADLASDQAVLDIGCGPGAAVRAAAPHVARAVGVDRSPAMIGVAERRSSGLDNVEFAVAAAEDLPFPDESFDRVWTIHAFHHWEDQDAGLTECLRVLRPGGRLLVVETRSNGAHGLSRDGADRLGERLVDLGFAAADATTSRRQLVVSGQV